MQLDFIGNIYSTITQLELFNRKREPSFASVERFFHSITKDEIDRHVDLWRGITPIKTEEIFRRYIFAFLSVHSTWETNVKAYLSLRNWWEWMNNETELLNRLSSSGAGLHNNRTAFLTTFSKSFWANPSFYQKSENETWQACRDRIEKNIKGLGLAKTSFSLEMIYPLSAQITCLDVHLFRFYGLNQSKDLKLYKPVEDHWVTWSKMFNIPSYISRVIYWNRNQGQKDCWYWANVFLDNAS
jgi:thermostable 8-oxoguanine DNA glycosylase